MNIITDIFIYRDVQLRWIQDNPEENRGGEFAIRRLYIGPACPYMCHGHGTCTAVELCKCDKNYNGKYLSTFYRFLSL